MHKILVTPREILRFPRHLVSLEGVLLRLKVIDKNYLVPFKIDPKIS